MCVCLIKKKGTLIVYYLFLCVLVFPNYFYFPLVIHKTN